MLENANSGVNRMGSGCEQFLAGREYFVCDAGYLELNSGLKR